jgi:predicted NAD/FAD-dependent oxidoreductase
METPLGEARFDHGAQYFTARDPGFAAVVAGWQARGVAAPWPDAGPDAWVGVPGMNAPVRHMAAAHRVHWSARIDALARDGAGWQLAGDGLPDGQDAARYDAVVMAVPAEQAAPLLRPWDEAMAAPAAATLSAPCWTAMFAFAAPLPAPATTLRRHGPIGWAARDSAKPGRSGPESWVVQASPEWSLAHLETDGAWVREQLLAALGAALGRMPGALPGHALPYPVAATAHRWRYALSGAHGTGLLFNPALGLGACGDWLIGPRVEAAWLSGDRLGAAMAGNR